LPYLSIQEWHWIYYIWEEQVTVSSLEDRDVETFFGKKESAKNTLRAVI